MCVFLRKAPAKKLSLYKKQTNDQPWDRDAVQRKHYSLLLQHFKDSLSQQAPGGGDKTSGNGAVVDEDYAEIRPPMMKGTAKKKETAKAAAGFPVDSGISNSSDNSAIVSGFVVGYIFPMKCIKTTVL